MDREDKLYIKDLTTRTKRGYLCVRVMRKWNYDGNIPGGPVTYIGLVLADEQRNAIYAQIPEADVHRLGSALVLDEIYTIRKFSVRTSRTSYVPFDAELMIQMTSFTTVTPSKIPHNAFPDIIYSITPFKDIKTTGQAATKFIDVLGIIVSEESPKTMCIKGRDQVSTLKELTIKDLSGAELTVTLWGDCVQRFSIEDGVTTAVNNSVVVLFCEKTLVNAGNACRWFFNPDILEAQPLYDSLKTQPVPMRRALPPAPDHQPPSKPKSLEHKSLSDMNSLDPYSFPEEGCRCTIAIKEIPAQQDWWYMGCEICKKRLWNYGGDYYCTPCKNSVAIPLYKLQFVGTDGTDDAKFFCYDVVARQIVRRNCESLLRAINNAPGLPQQLLNAVGREYVFTVGLTEQSFRSMDARVYLIESCVPKPQAQLAGPSGASAVPISTAMFKQTQHPARVDTSVDRSTSSGSTPTLQHADQAVPAGIVQTKDLNPMDPPASHTLTVEKQHLPIQPHDDQPLASICDNPGSTTVAEVTQEQPSKPTPTPSDGDISTTPATVHPTESLNVPEKNQLGAEKLKSARYSSSARKRLTYDDRPLQEERTNIGEHEMPESEVTASASDASPTATQMDVCPSTQSGSRVPRGATKSAKKT